MKNQEAKSVKVDHSLLLIKPIFLIQTPFTFVSHLMDDKAILYFQDKKRRLSSEIAQVKGVMRESPYFELSLDPNHYLKWGQALEG